LFSPGAPFSATNAATMNSTTDGGGGMTQERLLTGPSAPPKAGGPPRQLVVLLHGVGADGNDLISLAPYYHSVLPHAYIVSPNAPFPFDMAPFGYMWFSIRELGPTTRLNGVRASAPLLGSFLDAELARHRLSDAELLLVGFSQGAMMALHVGLRRARPPAGIIAHSGMVVADPGFGADIKARPPVLLTHGAVDEVLPAACLPAAEAALKLVRVPVEAHLMPGLGHGIDEATVRLALRFAGQCFEAR
jgi:phospholipase/carboxylesterase